MLIWRLIYVDSVLETVLTSGLLTSKPVNGVVEAMSETRPKL